MYVPYAFIPQGYHKPLELEVGGETMLFEVDSHFRTQRANARKMTYITIAAVVAFYIGNAANPLLSS